MKADCITTGNQVRSLNLSYRELIRAVLLLVIALSQARAEDWTQFRGADHNGAVREAILTNWPADGPRVLWRAPVSGYGSVAVSQGKVFALSACLVTNMGREMCLALDAETGRQLWATPTGAMCWPIPFGGAPFTTPSVAGDRVFVQSDDGVLICLAPSTGKTIWQKDIRAEYQATDILGSPAVDGDLLFVNCNGFKAERLLALRVSDGSQVWKAVGEKNSYATPVVATLGGIRQVLFHTRKGLVSVGRDSGQVLWQEDEFSSAYSSPVVDGDIVVVSQLNQARAVKVTRTNDVLTARRIWGSVAPGAYYATPIADQGYLYTVNGCFDLQTGKSKWSRPSLGEGALSRAGKTLVLLGGAGQLVLAEADSTRYRQLAFYRVFTNTSYNFPAVANGRIYARSTTEIACLDVLDPASRPLRLEGPGMAPGGGLQVTVRQCDGTAPADQRLAGLQLLSAPDLSFPLSQWLPLSKPPSCSNGVVTLDSESLGAHPQRFIIGIESPP